MSDSLIEQVKRLAACQKSQPVDGALRAYTSDFWEKLYQFDFPALLAHLERTQAVVEAARSVLTALGVDDVPYTGIKRALENLENNDGK